MRSISRRAKRAGPNGTPGNFKADYASSDFDIRKPLTSTVTYALPGKTSFGQMLQGWKLTSIVTIQSALPWGVLGSRGSIRRGSRNFRNDGISLATPEDFSGRKADAIPYFLPGSTPPAGQSASELAINNPACIAQERLPGSLGYIALQKWGCFVKGASVMTPPAIGTTGSMGRNMFRGNGSNLGRFADQRLEAS